MLVATDISLIQKGHYVAAIGLGGFRGGAEGIILGFIFTTSARR